MAAMRPKGKARGIYSRLERLEARTSAPAASPVGSPRVGDFLDRYVAWRHAGAPDTEEGRELQALAEAFRRRRAQLRGEGKKP